MPKWLANLIEFLAPYVHLFELLGGMSTFGAIAGWAAQSSPALVRYAPFSWVAAALAGTLIFFVIARLAVAIRTALLNADIRRRFYDAPNRLNPVQEVFRGERINISDLVPPYEPVIRGKTFIDCELIGPASILLNATKPGSGGFNGVMFLEAAGIVVQDGIGIPNCTVFEDCQFLRGKIVRVLIFVPRLGYDHVHGSFPQLPWITLPPPTVAD